MTHATKTILAAITLCLIAAASASAKIGETYSQVHQQARRDKDTTGMQVGRDKDGILILDVYYRDGDSIRHAFGSNMKEIQFLWIPDHKVMVDEIDKIQKIFRTKWTRKTNFGGYAIWRSDNNALEMWADTDIVCVYDLKSKEIPGAKRSAPVAPPPPIDSQPDPVQSKSSRSPNDCLIVATQAFARLKNSAYWARIAGFSIFENGKYEGFHAVVFMQPTAGSNVFMYDEGGSWEIPTQSHELVEIEAAVNAKYQYLNRPERITSTRWVESVRTGSVTSSTPGRVGQKYQPKTQETNPVAIVFGLIMMISFGLLARYGGVRIWPFAILSEPVYLIIEGIRNMRRTRKTKVISPPRQLQPDIITDPNDPVERALARVKANARDRERTS